MTVNDIHFSEIWGYFAINETFCDNIRGSQRITLPFGNVLLAYNDDKISNSVLQQASPITYDINVILAFPFEYIVSHMYPSPKSTPSFWPAAYNRTIQGLEWEFLSVQRPDSIMVFCENPYEIDYYQRLLFFSSLFIGMGIPIVLSAFFEYLKTSEKLFHYPFILILIFSTLYLALSVMTNLIQRVFEAIIVSIPISLISAYIWYKIREPRLKIEVVPKSNQEPAIHPQLSIAFYHLKVKNEGKSTAYDCELYISIKDKGGKKLFDLKGKWDRGPEPLGPIQPGGWSQIWPSLIPLTELVNVRPGIPETFCLVVKENNQKECYAFNAQSYFHNYKNPKWQLQLGEFIAEIDLRGGNAKTFSKFIIENRDTGIQDITIKKLD